MMKKVTIATSLMLVSIVSFAGSLCAQEATSPDKKNLLKELLILTNVQGNAEAVRQTISSQIEKDVLQLLTQAVNSNGRSLSEENRDKAKQMVEESAKRASQRFEVLSAQKVNYSQLVEEVSYEMYDKFYTTDELKDLISFYKSATGQKSIKVMPQLFAESMLRTSERLNPQLQSLIKEVMDEEMKNYEKTRHSKTPSQERKPS